MLGGELNFLGDHAHGYELPLGFLKDVLSGVHFGLAHALVLVRALRSKIKFSDLS